MAEQLLHPLQADYGTGTQTKIAATDDVRLATNRLVKQKRPTPLQQTRLSASAEKGLEQKHVNTSSLFRGAKQLSVG